MSDYQLIRADARRLPLANESVHLCVSSPPYLGLRDYGVGGQIGLERSIEEYVDTMVEVFREVWRVLRKDGVCWANWGDSYATAPNGRSAADAKAVGGDDRTFRDKPCSSVYKGLKPKDLCGIPWRVALALQADGWYLRSDVVYSKKNPMPSSVKDRPAMSHEYLFLLAKSERYFYDHIAVREPAKASRRYPTWEQRKSDGAAMRRGDPGQSGDRCRWSGLGGDGSGRNLRTVWTLSTQALRGKRFGVDVEHFAAFPEALVEPCILAGTSAYGCCVKCKAPWERIVKTPDFREQPRRATCRSEGQMLSKGEGYLTSAGQAWQEWRSANPDVTAGWRPTCRCPRPERLEVEPCRVLDMFCGSGTTGVVALRHGRDFVGVDLSADYLKLAQARIRHSLTAKPKKPRTPRPEKEHGQLALKLPT